MSLNGELKNRMIPEDVLESCKYILEMEVNYA